MTGKFTPVVLFICRKEVTTQMMNVLLFMVDLRVMDAFDTKTLTG